MIVRAGFEVAGPVSFIAVMIILWRLGYRKILVAAPIFATLIVAIILQIASSVLIGLPVWAFDLWPALKPALSLVSSAFIAYLALSKAWPSTPR
jgi:Sec-independent protein secretion pathway component TatC